MVYRWGVTLSLGKYALQNIELGNYKTNLAGLEILVLNFFLLDTNSIFYQFPILGEFCKN